MASSNEPSSNQIAQAKAQKALHLIEQAQTILGLACQELCPIVGACKQWEMVGKHYDKTKALWHRVNNTLKFQKIKMEDKRHYHVPRPLGESHVR